MNIHRNIYLLSTIAAVALLAGCNDHIPFDRPTTSTDAILFDCVDAGGWGVRSDRSRGAADEGAPSGELSATGVITMQADDPASDPVYLHSFEYDGIDPDDDLPAKDSRATGSAEVSNTNLFDHFGVTALYRADDASTPQVFISKEIVKPGSDGLWHTEKGDHYWPADGTMQFLGVFPSGSSNSGVQTRMEGTTFIVDHKTPYNSHYQNDLCVAIKESQCKDKGIASMKFYHAFTRVKFVASQNMLEGRINYIKIKNIHTNGTLKFPAGDFTYEDITSIDGTVSSKPTAMWEYDDPDIQDIIPGDLNNQLDMGEVYRSAEYLDPSQYDDATESVDITANYEHVFMLLPQKLPADAEIEISFTDKVSHQDLFDRNRFNSDEEQTAAIEAAGRILTANIGGSEWKAGTTKIYRISNSAIEAVPVLEVPQDFEFSWFGGKGTFDVRSYAVISDANNNVVEKRIIPWKLEYYDNNGAKIDPSSWLADMMTSGNGALDTENPNTFTFNVPTPTDKPSEYEDVRPHSDWIFGQTTKFGDATDLSLVNGVMNTANCYVVNAAGTYKFPLVYGNAIKNGVENKGAYTYKGGNETTTAEHVLNTFKNHLDNSITEARINKNAGCTPGNAKLVWQDRNGMIKNVKLLDEQSDGFRYIQFETGKTKEEVGEGNAVIAVTDAGGKIMWSWHIWMTDYIPYKMGAVSETYDPEAVNPGDLTVTSNYIGTTTVISHNTVMGTPVGWCADYIRKYLFREVKVAVCQNQSLLGDKALTKYVKITRKNGEISVNGNAPYYQFGRKDPLCPAEGEVTSTNGRGDKHLYGIDGNIVPFSKVAGPVKIYQTIQDPTSFITGTQVTWGPDPTDTDPKGGKIISGNNGWCKDSYFNLWSADVAGREDVVKTGGPDADIKTIYDPSPAGYQVPNLYAFTFATYGGGTSDINSFFKRLNSPYHGASKNGEGKESDDTYSNSFSEMAGLVLYRDYQTGIGNNFGTSNIYKPQSGTIFFPATGVRSYFNGNLSYTTIEDLRGYYWTSTPQFERFWATSVYQNAYDPVHHASTFGFHRAQIMPTVQNSRAGGISVRPVREK